MRKLFKDEDEDERQWWQLALLLIAGLAFWWFRRFRQQSEAAGQVVTWRRDIEMGPTVIPAETSVEGVVPAETRDEAEVEDTVEVEEQAPLEGPLPTPDLPATETPAGDDLEIIEGIGPKISSILQAAGIRTFRQLAEAEPARLGEIMREANLRLANPETWPEQARFAANGEWSKLETFQGQLKGGRRG